MIFFISSTIEPFTRVASSVVEHPAFNRLVLSSNLRRPIFLFFKFPIRSVNVINLLKGLRLFLLFSFVFCACKAGKAAINKFTTLIFVEDWLIERKIDLSSNDVKCRASLPINGSWFGSRIRLGSKDELIKPRWIPIEDEKFDEVRLTKVKRVLKDCRSGLLFLP